jgi:hypothetical protein
MAEEQTDAAAKLRKLGERLRRGAEKLHPVSEQDLEKVRHALEAQKQEEQERIARDREQDRDRGR